MARRDRRIKGRGQDYEVSEQVDDHILPSASEIALYAEADETLPQFIQDSAKKEQVHRHEMSEKGMKLSFREQRYQHGLNYLGMICAFALCLAGFWFSYILLKMGFEMQGTVFSGAMLIYMAFLFLRRRGMADPKNLPAK